MLTTFQMQALLTAAVWTAGLSLIAFVLGGAVGLLIAVMRVSANRVLRGIAFTYIQIVQGTPLLVMMMLAFFGYPSWLRPYALRRRKLRDGDLFQRLFRRDLARRHPCGSENPVGGGRVPGPASGPEVLAGHHPQGLRISTPPTVGFMVQIVKNTSLAR